MHLVRLPRELLLDLSSFEDLNLRDISSLRLTHPVLADVLASKIYGTVCVAIRKAKGTSPLGRDVEELIKDEALDRLRAATRQLKLSVPHDADRRNCTLEDQDRFNTSEGAVQETIIRELVGSLPNLDTIELSAWYGSGTERLTRLVLGQLGNLVTPGGNCKLSISMNGIQGPNCRSFMDELPPAVSAVEIRGGAGVARYLNPSSLEDVLKMLFTRGHINRISVSVNEDEQGPMLLNVLEGIVNREEAMDAPGLQDLEIDANMLYSQSEPSREIVPRDLNSLSRLKKLRISRKLSRHGLEGAEFWNGLLKRGIWLESIATSSISPGGSLQSAHLLRYLKAPQLADSLRVLDLQGFHWHYQVADTMKELSLMFWNEVVPCIRQYIEELTLLLYGRRDGKCWEAESIMPRLKPLHQWSLSFETVVYRPPPKIGFPNLRTLTTYAILDVIPEFENPTTPVGNTITEFEALSEEQEAALSLKVEDLLEYLASSPCLKTIELYVLPGGPLRSPPLPEMPPEKLKHKVTECVSKLSASIQQIPHTQAKFNLGTEMIVNIVEGYGMLQEVATQEYFYSTNGRWNIRRENVSTMIRRATKTERRTRQERDFPRDEVDKVTGPPSNQHPSSTRGGTRGRGSDRGRGSRGRGRG